MRSWLFGALVGLVVVPSVSAKTCDVTVSGNDRLQFEPTELSASAQCPRITITLVHTGHLPVNVMGHNWVLIRTDDYPAVMQAALHTGIANGYLPEHDARIIAHTRLIGGGEQAQVIIPTKSLRRGESYTYFCSFPGHGALMKGILRID